MIKRFITFFILIYSFSAMAFSFPWNRTTPDDPYSRRYKKVLKRQIGDMNEGPLVQQLKDKGFELGAPIYIRAFKKNNVYSALRKRDRSNDYGSLELWIKDRGRFRLFKKYTILKHSGDLGPKLKEGDKQVPEGFYNLDFEWLNFRSRFHLSMNIGYPNMFDQANGRTGKYIMVHGSNRSIGCLAMGNEAIEEIFTLVEKSLKMGKRKAQIDIYPFKLTDENLDIVSSKYVHQLSFWNTLKKGYDAFESTYLPAKVKVKNGQYIIKKRHLLFKK